MRAFTLLTILLFGASCHRPLTKNMLINKQQLTKNIDNISFSLQDKSGDIWVGTRQMGLYLFDGKKFISYSE